MLQVPPQVVVEPPVDIQINNEVLNRVHNINNPGERAVEPKGIQKFMSTLAQLSDTTRECKDKKLYANEEFLEALEDSIRNSTVALSLIERQVRFVYTRSGAPKNKRELKALQKLDAQVKNENNKLYRH